MCGVHERRNNDGHCTSCGRWRWTLLLLGLLLLFSPSAAADQEKPQVLRVCTTMYKPYVFPLEGVTEADMLALPNRTFSLEEFRENFRGFDVDLFTAIAWLMLPRNMTVTVTLHKTYPDSLYSTRMGYCDMAVGAYIRSATRQLCGELCPQLIGGEDPTNYHACCLQFSHVYDRSGYAMVQSSHGETSTTQALIDAAMHPDIVSILCWTILCLIISGHLIWLAERQYNIDFMPQYLDGVDDGVWWSVVTLTTVGYGDKTPVTHGGRVLGVLWMATGFIIMTILSSLITSEQIRNDILDKNVLPSVITADYLQKLNFCVVDGAYLDYLEYNEISPPVVQPLVQECYAKLVRKQVEAVLFDRVSIVTEMNSVLSPAVDGQHSLQSIEPGVWVSNVFERAYYAMAFTNNSQFLPLFNEGLQYFMEGNYIFSSEHPDFSHGWGMELARSIWLSGDENPRVSREFLNEDGAGARESPYNWALIWTTVAVLVIYLIVQFGGLLLREYMKTKSLLEAMRNLHRNQSKRMPGLEGTSAATTRRRSVGSEFHVQARGGVSEFGGNHGEEIASLRKQLKQMHTLLLQLTHQQEAAAGESLRQRQLSTPLLRHGPGGPSPVSTRPTDGLSVPRLSAPGLVRFQSAASQNSGEPQSPPRASTFPRQLSPISLPAGGRAVTPPVPSPSYVGTGQ